MLNRSGAVFSSQSSDSSLPFSSSLSSCSYTAHWEGMFPKTNTTFAIIKALLKWRHLPRHYAETIVSLCLHTGSASSERVGQREVGGLTYKVLCTWKLLVLTAKWPWLGPGGPNLVLAAWTGLENATLTLYRVNFWQRRLLGSWKGVCQPGMMTIACSLMSGHG